MVSGNVNLVNPHQYSTGEAALATDDDTSTWSCTDDVVQPWFAVDLGGEKDVDRVEITFPATVGDSCNYLYDFLHLLILQFSKWLTKNTKKNT